MNSSCRKALASRSASVARSPACATLLLLLLAVIRAGHAQLPSGPATLENLLDDNPKKPSAAAPSPPTAAKPGPGRVRKPRQMSRSELDRLPVPDRAKIEESQDLIRQAYEADYEAAGKNPTPLIDRLMGAAKQTNDSARRYALFLEAEAAAIKGGHIARAIEIVDIQSLEFRVDNLSRRLDAIRIFLEAASKGARMDSSRLEELSDYAMETAEWSLAEGQAAKAREAAAVAADAAALLSVLAKAGKNAAESTAVRGRVRRIEELTATIDSQLTLQDELREARSKLDRHPEDPASNAVVGRYLCFAKGDWQTGLAALARSDLPRIGEIAANELRELAKNEPDPQGLFEVASQWWKVADSALFGAAEATAMKRHAAQLYGSIRDKLTDPLTRKLAARRAAFSDTPPATVTSP